MLAHLRSFLIGKAYSYYLNGQADARDSQDISKFINTNVKSSNLSSRSKKIIDRWSDDPDSIIIAAYSLFFNNGYTDYVFARLTSSLVRHQLPHSKYYPHQSLKISDFIMPWFDVFINRRQNLNKFIQTNNLPSANISHQKLAQTVIDMQHINISINQQTIAAFEKKQPNPKIKALKKYQKEAPNPDVFISSALKTQKRAIFWDKTYIQSLNIVV